MNWVRGAVVAGVSLLTGAYYLWAVQASGMPFHWSYDLGGYYDYLARGFVSGHLYVPIEPSPKLLALADPYDPSVDESLKMGDMVLYNRHYYLYFGVTPAALLFSPWRMVTKHDLPENFALFLICFGGYLFSCAALLRVLKIASVSVGPGLLAIVLIALGFCQGVPYLLNRVWAYEIAIGSGYLCLSAAVYFLANAETLPRGRGSDPLLSRARKQAVPSGSGYRFAASGLMFALAVGCRPHLIFAGMIAFAMLAIFTREQRLRNLTAFVLPTLVIGAMLAAYNYERFGNPLEFGFRYQLSGPGQNRIDVSMRNVPPGLYYMLLNPPQFGKVFPWARLVIRNPYNSPTYAFPHEYFIEPTIGALWLAPFILAIAMLSKRSAPAARMVLWTAAASSGAILIFLISTHLMSQRYEVDFLPLAALASAGAVALAQPRRAIVALFTLLVAYSTVVNLAAGVIGPYDDILGNQPARYVRLARPFSPVAEFRPMLNPEVAAEFMATFTTQPPGFREPLLAAGTRLHGYALTVEHQANGLRIVSQLGDSKMEHDMPAPDKPVQIRVSFAPASSKIAVTLDGQTILAQSIGPLVTAPAQLTIGENRFDPTLSTQRFSGSVQVRQGLVREAR